MQGIRGTGAPAAAVALLAAAGSAHATEPVADGATTGVERRLEEVLAELEAQRLEIRALKERLGAAAPPAQDGVEDAVRKYLESEDGRAALGRGRDDLRVSWKDGLSFETKDKAFAMRIGGRLMYDVVYPDADGDLEAARGDFDRGNRIRRGRIELSSTMHGNVYFKFDVEFGATPHVLRDAHVGLRGVPYVGNLQVGVMKEPAGLEQLTSAKYTTFLERSFADAFVRNFNPGILAFDQAHEGRLAWAVGIFGDDDSRGTGVVGNSLVARLAGTPVASGDGARLLHLGASVQHRDPESRTERISTRGDLSIGPLLLDTGAFSVDTSTTLGLEAAYTAGPLSVQGEWMRFASREYRGTADLDPRFTAWYLQASYFLTGETRPYKAGAFQRVKPRTNFDGKGGVGAWEVALRHGRADLDSGSVAGGEATQWVVGVNWHLNPNARVMLNYGRQHLESVGAVAALALRFQVDF